MNDIEKEKENLIIFTKVGAIVLTSLLLLVTSIYFYPQTAATISSHVNTSQKELPIYCVDKGDEAKISISFDAAWGNEDTPKLLEILKQNDVRATFFMTGLKNIPMTLKPSPPGDMILETTAKITSKCPNFPPNNVRRKS